MLGDAEGVVEIVGCGEHRVDAHYAQVRHGNRPSFTGAMDPTRAREQWLRFNDALRAEGLPVHTGRFGAQMRVSLTNDGPVTSLFDSDELGG